MGRPTDEILADIRRLEGVEAELREQLKKLRQELAEATQRNLPELGRQYERPHSPTSKLRRLELGQEEGEEDQEKE